MNSSAGETADVPPGAVTVTFTTPVPAGLSAVMRGVVDDAQIRRRGRPEVDAVAPVKLVPLIVTRVPPASGPLVGIKPSPLAGKAEFAAPSIQFQARVILIA